MAKIIQMCLHVNMEVKQLSARLQVFQKNNGVAAVRRKSAIPPKDKS